MKLYSFPYTNKIDIDDDDDGDDNVVDPPIMDTYCKEMDVENELVVVYWNMH